MYYQSLVVTVYYQIWLSVANGKIQYTGRTGKWRFYIVCVAVKASLENSYLDSLLSFTDAVFIEWFRKVCIDHPFGIITVEDRMFLAMQGFDFAQIEPIFFQKCLLDSYGTVCNVK